MNAVPIDPDALKRLRWRCRRGMRELDRLFERQLDRLVASGSTAGLAQLERLLECEDDQLWRWSLGHGRPSDPALATLIDAIRARHPD